MIWIFDRCGLSGQVRQEGGNGLPEDELQRRQLPRCNDPLVVPKAEISFLRDTLTSTMQEIITSRNDRPSKITRLTHRKYIIESSRIGGAPGILFLKYLSIITAPLRIL